MLALTTTAVKPFSGMHFAREHFVHFYQALLSTLLPPLDAYIATFPSTFCKLCGLPVTFPTFVN
jgi:hypothetical protein